MDTPRLDNDRGTADLRFCYEQFESIRGDVASLAGDLSPAQLAWQPNASTWSVAQCIEHLNLSIEQDLERIAALGALARAARRATLLPTRIAPSDAPVILLHEQPRQALAGVTGTQDHPPDAIPDGVTVRFLELNRRLLAAIDAAAAIAATTAGHSSAALLLDMIGHALQLNALHHWRYILQARRVLERPGAPRR